MGNGSQSEYLASCDERVKFISGFSGSSGLCVVTQTAALMWTDGRYYLQAERQLEAGWEMRKMEPGVQQYFEYLAAELKSGQVIGVDPSQISAAGFRLRSGYFKEKGLELRTVKGNLVDKVWGDAKPPMPQEPVFIHDVKYAGLTVGEKFDKVAEKVTAKKADALLVTTLDDIDWIVNLRGNDINYNPVFFSYLIFYPEKRAQLFIEASKLADPAVAKHLADNKIEVLPYADVSRVLEELVKDKKVAYDENSCNAELAEALKGNGVHADNIVQYTKALKNPVEMQGMRNVNIKSCASLVQFFAWMEEHLRTNPESPMTEYTAAEKLEEFRRPRELYVGPSFDTISSIGPNGAIIHYKPEQATASRMDAKQIYLLDSGVQYLDGTTDITRTVYFGGATDVKPTDEQRDRYTRVLLGVLDLERIVWPSGGPYCGADFDTLARRHLWAAGVDYKHGTGHGVGSFNCVHEGPQGISRRSQVKLEVGMAVSNEPGFYKDGEYGIRIENVIMVNTHETFSDRLRFENLTFCPYSRELLDLSLLSPADREYLNNFNKKVWTVSMTDSCSVSSC